MFPFEALQNPVARFYLGLVLGLLFLVGPLLWAVRRYSQPAWRAYLGWLCMVPILIAALLLGRESAVVFFTLVALLGFTEFAQATGLAKDWGLTGGVLLGIVAAGGLTLIPWFDVFMTLPVFVVAFLLAVPILRNRVTGQLRAVTLAVFGFVYFGWMFGHVAFLINSRHVYAYLGYLLFAVEVNDIAAFVSGKLFGRHPLRANISPKKTWEGSLGALAVSLALPWGLWFTFPHLTPGDLVAVGLIVGVGGQFGDLVLSVIKRDLGIKDMGSTIPGHGGILDRVDSLTYAGPLLFHYLRFRHGLDSP